MPDEVTPETGNSTAATPDWESPDNPYIGRHRDTQAAFTQSQQQLADLRRYEEDEAAFRELAAKHGYQIDEPAPDAGLADGGFQDPRVDQVLAELNHLRQQAGTLEERQQSEDIERGRKAFNSDLDGWAKELDVELNDFDRAAIFQRTLDSDTPGPEAARAVFDEFAAAAQAREQAVLDAYRSGKRRAQRPGATSGEAAGTGKPYSEMTERDRRAAMVDRANELAGQQQI